MTIWGSMTGSRRMLAIDLALAVVVLVLIWKSKGTK